MRPFWVAVALAIVAAALALACQRPAEPFKGTELSNPGPAPAFRLTDHRGRTVSLQDYQGKVVVLTFLYTSCRDVCPIVTFKLKEVYEALGEDVGEVAFLAVTVDPERDTAERAREYSEAWGMADRWSFLVGSRSQLEPIWAAYYVDPTLDEEGDPAETELGRRARELTRETTGSVAWLEQAVTTRYAVLHSAPVYLVDRRGYLRVLFTPPLEPQDIVHDIRALLKGR